MTKFITDIIDNIKTFFGRNSAFKTIVEKALKNILKDALPVAIDLLSAVAIQKVSQVENSGMSNSEKRQQVLNALEAVAIKQGIQVGISVLNLILETAVNANKNK